MQKGDTLWELAKEYNVDYEEIKQLNTQLSGPDMIMPGMKVKVPSTEKQVKEKGSTNKKEVQKSKDEVAYKDISAKPLPTIKEDDHGKPVEVKAEMPMQHMPMKPVMEMPAMNKDMPKESSKPMNTAPVKEEKALEKKEHPMMELPMMNETPQMHVSHQHDHMNPKEYHECYPMMPMTPVCCCCMHSNQVPMHQHIPFHHGTHVSPKQAMPMPHPSQMHPSQMHMSDHMGMQNHHPMFGAQASPCGGQHRGNHEYEQQPMPYEQPIQQVGSMQMGEQYDQHQIARQQVSHAQQASMYPPNYATPPTEHSYPIPPGYGPNVGFNNGENKE